MKIHNYNDIRNAALSPEARRKNRQRAARATARLRKLATLSEPGDSKRAVPLAGLRTQRGVTQVELAKRLKVSQAVVSRYESSVDPLVSTLRNYVRALGGRLQIRAKFKGDDTVDLSTPDE